MIEISRARVNNLKDVSVNIPHNQFVVVSGVSGSGKSSLAFDTLYAEGQRRYVESLSSYARQFLGRMNKPECDYINGLPPAIAIEQRVISRNPRSTVGTTTEIYEYLRLLFARIGKTFSPISGCEVKKHTVGDVVDCMKTYPDGTKFLVVSRLHLAEQRTLRRQLEMSVQAGYSRLYCRGVVLRIDDVLQAVVAENANALGGSCEEQVMAGITHLLDAEKEVHENGRLSLSEVYLLVDRLSVHDDNETISRLTDSVETAFYEGRGECSLVFLPSNAVYEFSMRFEADGMTFEEPSDNLFAFNSPLGACPTCEGFGRIMGIDEHLVVPDTSLSVYDGCVQCWHGEKMGVWKDWFIRKAQVDNFPIFEPYYALSQKHKDWLWHGLPSEKGLAPGERVSIDSFFDMVKDNQYKIQYRVMMSRYRGRTICPDCHGTRLRKEANYVKVGGKSISQLVEMPVGELQQWFADLKLSEHEQKVASRILIEINQRLKFLVEVGLEYLTLNRPSNTLSGGESQRINLTTSLGSSLVGSLYILDEPSIGLHSRDTQRLISVLRQLQQIGNTVVVVEHDEEIMRAADYLIDVGPDAGRLGGEIVFEGSTESISKDLQKAFPRSHTLEYLTGTEQIALPESRRRWNASFGLAGCRMNNLKGINVDIPLNVMTVVTGVSGSGKSTLVKGILYPALKRALGEVCDAPGEFSGLTGDWKRIQRVEFVDQNPIGKSTRSNPATYVKAYDAIRQLFAEQQLAKQLGMTAQHVSFNTEGGRCEDCKGIGTIVVEMQFMADIQLECEACHGRRFKSDVLDVKFQGKNVYDVLDMTVNQALEFFSSAIESAGDAEHVNTGRGRRSLAVSPSTACCKQIVDRLKPLQDVGLGYIKLGQNSSTLSGGENQRIKLAYFISLERQEPTLFIFDEPTTGLHFHDINRLLSAFNSLILHGHTILVIEHNIDVIKSADHVIDIGPEGGNRGGQIVCAGTPEVVAECSNSYTGRVLKEKLQPTETK